MGEHWEGRKSFKYYQTVIDWVNMLKSDLSSIIDVGCCDTHILDKIDLPIKAAWDRWRIPEYGGDVKKYFGGWGSLPKDTFNFVLCLQVLEHLDNPADFCKCLKTLSTNYIIISVPYMWEDIDRAHKHFHINLDTVEKWVGGEPILSTIRNDLGKRLICVYRVEM